MLTIAAPVRNAGIIAEHEGVTTSLATYYTRGKRGDGMGAVAGVNWVFFLKKERKREEKLGKGKARKENFQCLVSS